MPNGQWQGHNRKASMPPGWDAIRAAVLRRDNHTCYKCSSYATHVDHVKNAASGGTDEWGNLAAMCEPCHRVKSSAEGGRAKAAKQPKRQRPQERHPGYR
jgi:5-methylcytosine-specific restriction protein A